jgi:muramidase (phage lysozyme)
MSELKITGNPNPVVGKEELYSVNQLLPKSIPTELLNGSKPNPFEQSVEWSIHVLENGRWIKKEENNKRGNKVSYKFIQKSLERKGIRILAKRGEQTARLDLKPHNAESPKIDSIEFLDKNGNKPTKPFAYGQTLKARVHCLHMENRRVYATLWEDDAAGTGHDKANEKNKMKTLPGTVKGGIADIDFVLEPDFAKIANAIKAKGDSSEGKTHEYYVTAEILNTKTASKNTNVSNPSYKDTTAKPATPKKQTPAQKKGPSKKREKEKSFLEDPIDWIEDKIKIDPIVLRNPIEIINSVLKVFKPDEKKEDEKKDNKKGVCESEARVRAFMRMLRKGEGTQGESGYTKQFGGGNFTDMNTHPQEIIHSGNYYSSAAGAYQIMGYTYYWLNGEKLKSNNKREGVYEKEHDYIKKYNIKDFKPESQDKLCLIILKHKRPGSIDLIIKDKIKEALEKFGSYEWASLPPGRYGQPTQTMDGALMEYNRCLKEELAGKTNLYIKKGFLKEFGYNCCDDKKTEESLKCNSCNKKHIDLRDKVKWQTQFDSKWGNSTAQNSACKKTCDDILINNGLKATSLSRLFQTAIENDTHTKLNVDSEVAKKGVAYLDNELEKGNPVQVGVDHDLNYKINNNSDHSTDHFIVIVGRGCEDKKTYYSFYDVGTSFEKKGASDNNRLYLDTSNNSLKGKTVYNGNFYTVTQIRKN